MSLIGGGGSGAGGAGNPVGGSNPAGIGQTLNYIGNHAYATSGMVAGTTSGRTTYLEFQTGNAYIIGELQQGSTNETTRKTVFVSYDDQRIIQMDVDNAYPFPNDYKLLIPPQTKVKIELQLGGDDGMSSWFTFRGRVYS
jgi:hypothetical protein